MLLVAPATANILAKFAAGIADDFLSTLYVSTTTPVVVAPAMNVEMWNHSATQANIQKLRRRGVSIVPPSSGYLACGEYGEGRLADPEAIVRTVIGLLRKPQTLAGVRVLVTAGPTIEDIDPVRFISNRSSGKMGYALASEAQRRGAEVVLVTGPTHLEPPPDVKTVQVRSARQMEQASLDHFKSSDIVVMAAAVSDYRPEENKPNKIKKSDRPLQLNLLRTGDILKEMGVQKEHQILVGFAAESENLIENAIRKLDAKDLDLIVANDIAAPGEGFESDTNRVTMILKSGKQTQSPLLSKAAIAELVWDQIAEISK